MSWEASFVTAGFALYVDDRWYLVVSVQAAMYAPLLISPAGVGSGVGRSTGWLLGGRWGPTICCEEKMCSPLLLVGALPLNVGVVTKVKLPASLGVPSLSFLLRPPQFNLML